MGAIEDRLSSPTALPATATLPQHDEAASGTEPETSHRKTQRMSALQFQALMQEQTAEPPRISTTARAASRAATVEDAEATAELAALTASPSGTASKFAFDTSDEREVSALPAREPRATVEMTPEMIVPEPRAARAPLATMELSSDMILQIAVNAPLAVKRPPLATMELTADMILPAHLAAKRNSVAPPAVPATVAPRTAAPELPAVIVDERSLHREDIRARAEELARRIARAIETALLRITRPPLDTTRLAAIVGFELVLTVSLLLLVQAC